MNPPAGNNIARPRVAPHPVGREATAVTIRDAMGVDIEVVGCYVCHVSGGNGDESQPDMLFDIGRSHGSTCQTHLATSKGCQPLQRKSTMATRKTHARKCFVYSDGSTGRSAKPGWSKLRFEMVAPDKVNDDLVVVDTLDISPDVLGVTQEQWDALPPMVQCAAGYGLSQKYGDDYAGIEDKAAKDDEAPAYDKARGWADYIRMRVEASVEDTRNGIWVAESDGEGGGGNITMLFNAVLAAYDKAGKAIPEEKHAALRQKLADKEEAKKARGVPQVKAELERIKLERQQARQKEAAKAAKESGATLTDLV